MQAIERYGNDKVRVVCDIPNAYFIGENFAAGLLRCRGRLEMVHLSDTGNSIGTIWSARARYPSIRR